MQAAFAAGERRVVLHALTIEAEHYIWHTAIVEQVVSLCREAETQSRTSNRCLKTGGEAYDAMQCLEAQLLHKRSVIWHLKDRLLRLASAAKNSLT